jgi:hypothetical protein
MCILYKQRDATYTLFFVIISVVHVSGGYSAHHQELIKLYVQPHPRLHMQFYKLLKMGEKPAHNMYSADNNKEHCNVASRWLYKIHIKGNSFIGTELL